MEVGEPVPGVSIRITDINDRVLREGEVGRLQVTGAPVMHGYHGDPELNRRSFTADGWLITGDLGIIRDGRLTVTGREKDVVIVNGVNYPNHEIEAVAETVGGVERSFTAACAVRVPGDDTDSLAIFFCPAGGSAADPAPVVHAIRERVARKVGISPRFIIPLGQEEVPKTAIGKIERSRLRSGFERDEFASRAYSMHPGDASTLPRWFHRITWLRREPPVLAPLSRGATAVILDDHSALGDRVCDRLNAAGVACTRIGPDYRYQDVARLLTAAAPPRILVDLREYGQPDGPADEASYDLVRLSQALDHVALRDHRLTLVVAASSAQRVTDTDDVVPGRAASVAILKTIRLELPWVRCRHVDLPAGSAATNADRLVRELRATQADAEVAYRGEARLVPRLERVEFADAAPGPLPLVRGGGYLVTGGLGGIGLEFSRWLLEELDARLLIVGRSDPRLALAQLCGDVAYERGDVCDLAALTGAVRRAEERWGTTLDGIVHLAGLFREQPLVEETQESFRTATSAKVAAMRTLEQLLEPRPQAMLLCFSSVNAFFGGPFAGAYAAANRYLVAFCDGLRTRRTAGVYCPAWSIWDNTGMSRDYAEHELSRARGFQPVPVAQGLTSLQVALRYREPRLLIGLDPTSRRIMPLTLGGPTPLRVMRAYVDSPHGADLPADMSDRFGTPFRCEVVNLDKLPLTPTGEVDREALREGKPSDDGSFVPPRTELERRIAELWQDLLHVPRAGADDSFFALGGHSLLAAQLASRLRTAVGVHVPVRTIFESPRLDALAAAVLARRLEADVSGDDAALLKALEQMSEDEATQLALRKTRRA